VEGWQQPKRQRRLWCEGDSEEERKTERGLLGLAYAAPAGQRRKDPIGHALSRGYKVKRGAKKPIRSLTPLIIRL
jgi:hypothetical protein